MITQVKIKSVETGKVIFVSKQAAEKLIASKKYELDEKPVLTEKQKQASGKESPETLDSKLKGAFTKGGNAFRSGAKETENPYKDAALREKWDEGYLAASIEAEEAEMKLNPQYTEGFEAYPAGKELKDNPYSPETEKIKFDLWEKGYRAAKFK
jgi:hypothetical protein